MGFWFNLGILGLVCYNGPEREIMNQEAVIDGLYRFYFIGSIMAVAASILVYYLVGKSRK